MERILRQAAGLLLLELGLRLVKTGNIDNQISEQRGGGIMTREQFADLIHERLADHCETTVSFASGRIEVLARYGDDGEARVELSETEIADDSDAERSVNDTVKVIQGQIGDTDG